MLEAPPPPPLPPMPAADVIILVGSNFQICDSTGIIGSGNIIYAFPYSQQYNYEDVDTEGYCYDILRSPYDELTYNTWSEYINDEQKQYAILVSNTNTLEELKNYYLENYDPYIQVSSRGFLRTLGPSSSSSSQ